MSEETNEQAPVRRGRADVSEIASLLMGSNEGEPDEVDTFVAESVAEAAGLIEPQNSEPAPESASVEVAEEQSAAPVRSFNDLAEQAGLDMKDFYKLEVRLSGDAEPVTLGALKDAWQEGHQLDERKRALEEQNRDLQNEVLRRTKGIQALMGQLQLSEEQVQRAALEFDTTRATEQEKLFAIMPELRDPGVRSQQDADLAEMLADYGVSKAEIDNIADARFSKFAYDALQWKKTIAAADPDAKRVRKTAGKTAGKPRRVVTSAKATETDKLVTRAKQTGMKGDQIAAISALLGSN